MYMFLCNNDSKILVGQFMIIMSKAHTGTWVSVWGPLGLAGGHTRQSEDVNSLLYVTTKIC